MMCGRRKGALLAHALGLSACESLRGEVKTMLLSVDRLIGFRLEVTVE